MTLLKDLPIVIIGPGIYRMRGGGEVRINHIRGTGTFSAIGHRRVMFRGAIRERGYNIWHVSGKFLPCGDSKSDIVERIDA